MKLIVPTTTTNEEVRTMAKEQTPNAVTLASDDEALYTSVIENPKNGTKSGDPDSAFSKFRTFRDTILRVALNKGNKQVQVGRVIQGAVDQKIVPDYRRGYNYHTQMIKSLSDGWVIDSVNGKRHYIYTK